MYPNDLGIAIIQDLLNFVPELCLYMACGLDTIFFCTVSTSKSSNVISLIYLNEVINPKKVGNSD